MTNDDRLEERLDAFLHEPRPELSDEALRAAYARTVTRRQQRWVGWPRAAVAGGALAALVLVVTTLGPAVLRPFIGTGPGGPVETPLAVVEAGAPSGTPLSGGLRLRGLAVDVVLDLGVRRWILDRFDDGRLAITPSANSFQALAILHVSSVYDPTVATQDGALLPLPDDFAAWLESHPLVTVVGSRPVTIAGHATREVTFRASDFPPGNACGACLMLAELGRSDPRPLSINADSTMRLAHVRVDDHDLLVMTAARTLDFNAFVRDADEVIATLRLDEPD